ncbi:PP2C family protein-serine/threonine phosphatase [Rhodoflexus caldus]|uniref:PP2C family protein-serine/threonine phosphatase n=1 Tax=Rhodoflexus caldus TaxID=2891236 RepID=UPI002029ED42|nr:SpoIIE family protein phosphatase [Rhodoflexus caldus]
MNTIDPTKLSKQEIKAVFSNLNKKSDTIVNYLLAVKFLFGLAIAPFYDTWLIAVVVGGSCLGLYYAAKWLLPQSSLYQYVLSAISAIFAAQFIYQMHGLFEMHFWVFISATVLIIYRNWRLQIPLITIVVIHHATFAYLQYTGFKQIYFTQLDYMSLTAFIFHGILAAAVSGISGTWAYMLYKQTVKDALYAKILDEQQQELLVTIERNDAYTEEIKQTAEELHASNEQLSKVNQLLQKQNFNIKSSIQYAQRIQEALLPDEERLREIFPEYFVFYKPRDVVSGDFFWATQIGEKKILIVGDCTGHGVPGAFMSLIGINFVYEIIKMNQTTAPAQILNSLRVKIYNALKQETTGNRDGMDISVVVIDPTANTLSFAGAKQNLVLFDSNGKCKTLKGDKMSIGGSNSRETFHEYTEPLTDKVFAYAFTDGYRDQIGGEHKRKLGSKNFTELLGIIHRLPVDMQKQQLHTFIEEWQKQSHEKQLDDMLVVGVKL